MSNFFVGLILGITIGLLSGEVVTLASFRYDAVRHNAAHMNSINGQFEWNSITNKTN